MGKQLSSAMLAKELQAYRLVLVSRARPPVTPSDTAINGTMFTPFVGVPTQNALDLCVVWSLYGLYMRKNFWPCPKLNPAELGAQAALRDLEKQGWETLPMAILGMPNLPPAWMVDNWKPIGGCKFTGYCPGIVGTSALRFCLLLRWRAAYQPASEQFFQSKCRVTAFIHHSSYTSDHTPPIIHHSSYTAHTPAQARGRCSTL